MFKNGVMKLQWANVLLEIWEWTAQDAVDNELREREVGVDCCR